MKMLGLTKLAMPAFGRAVLVFQWCAVFPRVARKNRTQSDWKVPCCRRQKHGFVTQKSATA